MDNKQKVLVIGLDGATFNVITPLIKKGELPNFNHIMETGASAELQSTIPPLSASAWASFMTGMDPSNHGAFDFVIKKRGMYEGTFLNGTLIKAPAFWETLGNTGKKVLIQNVMGTYPPKPLNGYLITGFLSPPGGTYTYPDTLKTEFEKRFGEYPRAPGTSVPQGEERAYIENIYNNAQKRAKITKHLMENKEWDLCVVVFEATDVLQHAFWKYYDDKPQDTKNDKNLECMQNAIPDIYKKFDEIIGDFLAKIDENTTVIVLSDHGFDRLKKVMFMNNLLLNMNMLVLKQQPLTQLKKLCLRYHFNAETFLKIGEKIGIKIKGAAMEDKKGQQAANKLFLSKHDIDWEATKAFSIGVGGHIYINLKEREPLGAVSLREYNSLRELLIKTLQNVKDPQTGEKIIERVYRKEDLYQGQFSGLAPDISILPRKGYFPLYKEHFISPSFLMDSSVSGGHTLHGIFMIKGKGIREGMNIPEIKIWDVPAVILKIFGVDYSYMDGRIPHNLFL